MTAPTIAPDVLASAARAAVRRSLTARRATVDGREPITDSWRSVLAGIEESAATADGARADQLALMAVEAKQFLADAENGRTALHVGERAWVADGDQWFTLAVRHVDVQTCTGRRRADRMDQASVPLGSVPAEMRCPSDVCGPHWPVS